MGKDTGGPAFARPHSKNGEYSDSPRYHAQEGMSLRDYFAAKALAGFLANPSMIDGDGNNSKTCAWIADCSYAMADAMLAARVKP